MDSNKILQEWLQKSESNGFKCHRNNISWMATCWLYLKLGAGDDPPEHIPHNKIQINFFPNEVIKPHV